MRAEGPATDPLRTCVGCRQVKAKRELIRLVRDARGVVTIDPTGSRAGRGAYICSSCTSTTWTERGLRGRLAHAFRRPSETGANLIVAVRGAARALRRGEQDTDDVQP